jgi:transcriptional regulator with XRE-family HTH domain
MPATSKRRQRRPAEPGARFLDDVVADNVRDLRALRHMSQKALAANMEKLGHDTWSAVTVSDIERGKRSLSFTEALALGLILEASPTDLADPTGIEGRDTSPVDIGVGVVGAVGIRAWLRGAIRVRTSGPRIFTISPVAGHEEEFDQAREAWRTAVRVVPFPGSGSPAPVSDDETAAGTTIQQAKESDEH